MQTNKMSILYW